MLLAVSRQSRFAEGERFADSQASGPDSQGRGGIGTVRCVSQSTSGGPRAEKPWVSAQRAIGFVQLGGRLFKFTTLRSISVRTSRNEAKFVNPPRHSWSTRKSKQEA